MKTNRALFQLGVLIAIAVMSVTVFARVIARPPDASKIAGVWSGYSDDQVEFMRLELDANGTGYVCVSYLTDAPARLYRIESWRTSEWNVEIQTRPIDAEAPAITFRKLRYGLSTLDGEFGGLNAGWKHQIKLYGERDWQSRAIPTQERIAKHRKEKQ